ncbi:hypothetical protein FNL37_2013 [Methylovorus glucosotrophus]|nr:hypothetical protein FNL37_2013 [Methylovorus glucosotrophus]
MKIRALKIAMTSVFALASAYTMAAGFVPLPTTGFSVTGGTSAYRYCSTCDVSPASATTPPISGYSLALARTFQIKLNDATHTNNTDVVIGTLRNYLWRNTTTNMCIFGVRLTGLTGNDYDLNTPGTQIFEINDIAYGGFAAYNGTSDVNVAYYVTSSSGDYGAFRAGRTHTAVQYRSSAGYVDLPLTTSAPAASTSINGLTSYPSGTPTAAQQAAALSPNWVTFTTRQYDLISEGTAQYYIEASCPSATYTTTQLDDAIKIRQTRTGDLIEIKVRGLVPGTGSSATTY